MALGLSVCGGQSESPETKQRSVLFEQSLSGELSKVEADQLQLAMIARQQALTSMCMSKHGFTYAPAAPADVFDVTTETDFNSASYAKQYGFGITSLPHLSPPDRNASYFSTLSPQRRQAWDKTLSSCDSHATSTSNDEYGVNPARSRFNKVSAEVQKDSAYTVAQAKWVSCARAAGVDTSSRLALIDSLRQQGGIMLAQVQASVAQAKGANAAAAAAKVPGYTNLRDTEIHDAVATFPCSQALDPVYVATYKRLADR